MLNDVYKVFDERIDSFDVYKVESINEKYMVASGVPQPNGRLFISKESWIFLIRYLAMYIYVGNRHADEIVQLSLSLLKALKTMRENSSKFPRVQGRIGVHSGE